MKHLLAITLFALFSLAAQAKEKSFTVSTKDSAINWTGKKITGQHHGKLGLKSGHLLVDKSQVVGGEFQIDMTVITIDDLADDKSMHDKLANHLKSDDFFSVEKFKEATFKITKVEKQSEGKVKITGDLTIKGITHPISFPADIKMEKNKVTATAKMDIDRTKWNIKYRSGTFFPDLGDKVIRDNFTVEVNLAATN